jgi:penicillin-binding protein 2
VTEGRAGFRLKVLAGLVAVMFVALTTRLWFLQVLAYERSREAANQNAVRIVDVPAPRGRILDANGQVLVQNRRSLVVTVNRQEAGDHEEEIIFQLSKLLGLRPDELAARIDDPRYYVYQPVPVATDVQKRVALYIGEHASDLPGVDVARIPVRTYPNGSLAAHVLGYLGQISPDQLKDPSFAGYQAGDLVGVAGVEKVYEHYLRGSEGYVKYRVDSRGQNLGEIGHQDPVPGDDVQLTVDLRTQQLAEESLRLGMDAARGIADSTTGSLFQANAGAVVVMDPKNGDIVALASSPSFNPSTFVRPMTKEEYKQRFGHTENYPLLDRAIYGLYPPGSTYKPFIALSALHRGLASMTRGYSCPPTWEVPEDPQHHVFHNWSSANLGYMSLAKALWMSCDTIFYPFGYEYWRVYYPPPWADGIQGNDDQPAREPLQRDLMAAGFGRPTNVDLPGERAGRVPTAEWKRQTHRDNPQAFPEGDWFPGDFVNMSIGQGDTLVSPLQIAQAYSALMNGGHLCVPHVLDRVRTTDGKLVRAADPRCQRELPFTQQQLTYVRDSLSEVPRYGTAQYAFRGFPFSQVWIAGKTGTAQVANQQDYSWFAAMTSAQGKEYVIVALVEQGGHGSTTAAPIVRRIVEGLYGLPESGLLGDSGTD